MPSSNKIRLGGVSDQQSEYPLERFYTYCYFNKHTSLLAGQLG
jgi:hypothetical protein